MDRLPSPEDRQWLTHALKKVLARGGVSLLDAAPLVEPTNEWFPEKWAQTAAHGHRLAQRLMYYAGLDDLSLSLSAFQASAFDDDDQPWDAGTAGWFAGIHSERAIFGLHVRQFRDPEGAAGVLAHEVAHAWRHHHHLVVDERDKEEQLTDVTTIALGFGILTTNNTDRYRSSGNWSVTQWSFSSAGYLSPQAMSWLLAVWCLARDRGEQKVIEKHLEPNQRSYFRAAIEELERGETDARDLLRVPYEVADADGIAIDPDDFEPDDPGDDEIYEPPVIRGQPAPKDFNRGQVVYQTARRSVGLSIFMAAWFTGIFVLMAVLIAQPDSIVGPTAAALGVVVAASVFAARSARKPACSACNAHLDGTPTVCPGCGGTVGRRVTARELAKIREEEMDRRANEENFFDDCEECEPENPCERHAQEQWTPPAESEPEVRIRRAPPAPISRAFKAKVLAACLAVLLAIVGRAYWKQQHVNVYFDSALNEPVTLDVDGERFDIISRPPQARELTPGRHHVVVTAGKREIEHADVDVNAQDLWDAFAHPQFYVYSVAAAGAYRRSHLVYSVDKHDRGGSSSEVIALRQWFPQNYADFMFYEPPSSIEGGGRTTRDAFEYLPLAPRRIAETLYREGQTEKAITILRRALESAPCDEPARRDLIELCALDNHSEQRRVETTAWVHACDDSINAHRAYQDLSPRSASVAAYKQRLEANPSAANHYLYGRLLKNADAIAQYREALRIDPKLTRARIALGLQLLESEQDAEAYTTLSELMHEETVDDDAASYFAMAAIATNRIDEARAVLENKSSFYAKWILARAKGDWPTARVLLADHAGGDPSPENVALRAELERDAGEPVISLAEDLERKFETRAAGTQLRFEDALENRRWSEAAAMDLSALRTKSEPVLDDVYAVEAAMLGHLPDVSSRAGELRRKLANEPLMSALLDAAEGRITKQALMDVVDENGLSAVSHAWFALAVHASAAGEDAKPLFRKSAERALDRAFPYRIAAKMDSWPQTSKSTVPAAKP